MGRYRLTHFWYFAMSHNVMKQEDNGFANRLAQSWRWWWQLREEGSVRAHR